MLAACKKSRNAALADLVEFSLFTGVRRGEALSLTWDRVDCARGVIRLELTKSGRRREVPLSSNADGVLAQEALGHQTVTMTRRYSHLAPDHLRAAVAVLDGVLTPPQLSGPTAISAHGSAQELVPAGEVSQSPRSSW